MNNKTSTPRSRWLLRLSAPLAGLALLGSGLGAAQAHDYGHHDRSTVNVHRHLPIHRDHDRRDYGHHRDYHRNDRYGWRGQRNRFDHRDYRDHRYARDGWHDHDRDRGLFGHW